MKILLVANYRPDRQESMLRFADALAEGLRAAGAEVDVIRPEPLFGKLSPVANGIGKWLGYLDKFLVFPPRLREAARRAEVVHICDHSNAFYVRHIERQPHLVTCNDLLAVRSARGEFTQNPVRASGRILQRLILRGLGRARRITCISAATRADVLRLTGQPPERVSVTYMGQNFAYAPAPDSPRPHARPYLLHVGGGQWYKNRDGVLRMHAELCARLGDSAPDMLIAGQKGDAGARVRFIEKPDNETLRALYTHAELLLFPSLAEGFGWPIIEAQACGCRVVTTGAPPMSEVGGDAAFYLTDPMDAKAGAALIEQALAQPSVEKAACIAAGIRNAARFSTEKMVREYLAIYEELLAR